MIYYPNRYDRGSAPCGVWGLGSVWIWVVLDPRPWSARSAIVVILILLCFHTQADPPRGLPTTRVAFNYPHMDEAEIPICPANYLGGCLQSITYLNSYSVRKLRGDEKSCICPAPPSNCGVHGLQCQFASSLSTRLEEPRDANAPSILDVQAPPVRVTSKRNALEHLGEG